MARKKKKAAKRSAGTNPEENKSTKISRSDPKENQSTSRSDPEESQNISEKMSTSDSADIQCMPQSGQDPSQKYIKRKIKIIKLLIKTRLTFPTMTRTIHCSQYFCKNISYVDLAIVYIHCTYDTMKR
jgi:hypothetical protein